MDDTPTVHPIGSTDAAQPATGAWAPVVFGLLVTEAILWGCYFLLTPRGGDSLLPNGYVSKALEVLVGPALIILIVVGMIKRERREVGTLSETVFWAIQGLSIVVFSFATIYYQYGMHNWSKTLSHVDAIFIALGTMTSAGTGELEARSEFARILLMLQMVVDIFAFTIIVALVVERIALGGRSAKLSK